VIPTPPDRPPLLWISDFTIYTGWDYFRAGLASPHRGMRKRSNIRLGARRMAIGGTLERGEVRTVDDLTRGAKLGRDLRMPSRPRVIRAAIDTRPRQARDMIAGAPRCVLPR